MIHDAHWPVTLDSAGGPAGFTCSVVSGRAAARSAPLGGGNGLRNVFIKVVNPPDVDVKAPADPVVITLEGCVFKPRVAGVMVGQDDQRG